MKKTLNIFLILAASVAVSTAAYAQTAGPTGTQGTLQTAPAKHKASLNWKVESAALKEILPTLSLTPQQQTQMDDLKTKTVASLDDIRKSTKGDKIARDAKMHDLAESFHKDFTAILTPVQDKQFKEAHKAFMKKWHEEQKAAKAGTTTTTPTTPAPTPAPSGGGQ
jgi:Spy/CpxP family protein refolding chaperone